MAELSRRLVRLREISSIMTAMKNLSLVETHKLSRFMGPQRRMLANIETVAADFLHFYPLASEPATPRVIVLLVGSERGFCGNFNERVRAALPAWPAGLQPDLVSVGQRMTSKLSSGSGQNGQLLASVEGPTVTEEVPAVLGRLMDALHTLRQSTPTPDIALFSLAHDAEGEPRLRRLLPLPSFPEPGFTQAPQLQLVPGEFLGKLLDQYLLATLHGLLYESLAAESRQRLAHMEHAIERLDETLASLALKRNALRQEKIIEEIEVMLSGESQGND